jgi:hypothetical protein
MSATSTSKNSEAAAAGGCSSRGLDCGWTEGSDAVVEAVGAGSKGQGPRPPSHRSARMGLPYLLPQPEGSEGGGLNGGTRAGGERRRGTYGPPGVYLDGPASSEDSGRFDGLPETEVSVHRSPPPRAGGPGP